jgi:hypothetical protein
MSNPFRLSRMSERNLAKAREYRNDILQERRDRFYHTVKEKSERTLGA